MLLWDMSHAKSLMNSILKLFIVKDMSFPEIQRHHKCVIVAQVHSTSLYTLTIKYETTRLRNVYS